MKRINLIPQTRKDIYSFPKFLVTVLLVITFISFVFEGIEIIRLKLLILQKEKKTSVLKTEKDNIESQYQGLSAQKDSLLTEKKRIEEKIRIIKEVKAKGYKWSGVLSELTNIVAQDIWFKEVFLNRKELKISGSTFDNISISKFMKDLDDSSFFKQTNFSYTKEDLVKKEERAEEIKVTNFEVLTYLEKD